MLLTVFLIIAIIAGLYMAWNIGANDVANAMGTPVGSGAITLRKAVILAGIFEFLGAFFVGSNVAETLGKGIVPMKAFQETTEVAPADKTPSLEAPPPEKKVTTSPAAQKLAIGMLAALIAAGVWLNVATFFGQPVSTTHAIVGAVMGFAAVSVGPQWIEWGQMSTIAASWVLSPLIGGFIAFVVYKCIRRFVLMSHHPVIAARETVPLALGAVTFILSLSCLYKGLHLNLDAWHSIPIAAGIAISAAVVVRVVLNNKVKNSRIRRAETYNVVEKWFSRIQILTGAYMAFAHGANDVANAIGPLAVAVKGFSGSVADTKGIPVWLLALGGGGIVIGLATYGYKVIRAIGEKITEITPTRGFSAEFGTATTVLVCSKMGLPISTTFVLVGAVMGVGLARGFAAIDLKVIRRIFTSWLITIPISAFLAAVFYWILAAAWSSLG